MAYVSSVARIGLALLVVFPALTSTLGSRVLAEISKPEDLIIVPSGAVDVRTLLPSSRAVALREVPRRFPHPDLLQQLKKELRKKGFTETTSAASVPIPTTIGDPTPPPSPSVSANFPGLRQSESGGFYPPDTQVAAGPLHVLEAVNLEARIWLKTNPPVLVNSFDLRNFFGANRLADPRIQYDSQSGRWFILIVDFSGPTGSWRLAVSNTNDPTGLFVFYTIPSAANTFPDFPKMGMSDDKVVLTGNAFTSTSEVFVGTEFVVVNKSQLLAGGPVNGKFYGPPQGLFTIEPAQTLASTTTTVPTTKLYMAAVAFNSARRIRIWTLTGVPPSSVTVKATNLPIPTLSSPPDAEQQGTSSLIVTNDNSLLDAVVRNGLLWVSATSACTPNGDSAVRACLRFMQIQASGSPQLVQSFDFGAVGTYYYYPAIQVDQNDNLIAVFSGSSGPAAPAGATYASVYASGQLAGSAFQFGTPVLIKSGESAYLGNRWGDYSGAGIDSNDATVWVSGEYAFGTNQWGTWIAEVGF